MVFNNMTNDEAGMPLVFNAPGSFTDLLVLYPLTDAGSTKNQCNSLHRMTFLQRGSHQEIAIQIEGTYYTTLSYIKGIDPIYPITDIMVSNPPCSKRTKNDTKIQISSDSDLQICVGLDRVGLSIPYQVMGSQRYWRRIGVQMGNNQVNLAAQYESERVMSDTDRGALFERVSAQGGMYNNQPRGLFWYYNNAREITRKPKTPYQLAKLAFLVELNLGAMSKLINKAGRKVPHGSLNLMAKINSAGQLSLKVEGRDIENQVTLERANLPKPNTPEVFERDWEGSTTVHYKEWFRIIREKKANGYSLEKALDRQSMSVTEELKELIGITTDGNLVYGIKKTDPNTTEEEIFLVTFPITELPLPIPEEEMAGDYVTNTVVPSSTESWVDRGGVEPFSDDTPPVMFSEFTEEENNILTEWWLAHVAHCRERSQPTTFVEADWFRHYMSLCLSEGRRVGEDHLDLYQKTRELARQ